MKTLVRSLLCLSLFATPLVAGKPPAVTAGEAVVIAEKSLADRDLQSKIFVESVQLDRSSLLGGSVFWFVRWSETLPASDPRNREVGVKVYMDGRAVRLVKEPGAH